jgi:hypothetical protein
MLLIKVKNDLDQEHASVPTRASRPLEVSSTPPFDPICFGFFAGKKASTRLISFPQRLAVSDTVPFHIFSREAHSTALMMMSQIQLVSTWKQHSERTSRYDGFTLKKTNDIEGLTKHHDHTRTVCSQRFSDPMQEEQESFPEAKLPRLEVLFSRKEKNLSIFIFSFSFKQRTSSPLPLSHIYSQ